MKEEKYYPITFSAGVDSAKEDSAIFPAGHSRGEFMVLIPKNIAKLVAEDNDNYFLIVDKGGSGLKIFKNN